MYAGHIRRCAGCVNPSGNGASQLSRSSRQLSLDTITHCPGQPFMPPESTTIPTGSFNLPK